MWTTRPRNLIAIQLFKQTILQWSWGTQDMFLYRYSAGTMMHSFFCDIQLCMYCQYRSAMSCFYCLLWRCLWTPLIAACCKGCKRVHVKLGTSSTPPHTWGWIYLLWISLLCSSCWYGVTGNAWTYVMFRYNACLKLDNHICSKTAEISDWHAVC